MKMCKNGLHEMTAENSLSKKERKNGKVYAFTACAACNTAKHRRYDQSWRGQERLDRMAEKRKAG